ncbi:diguanylate cyclase/phosphodiesterase (GGDEF & EAL domains) with PAS/PAC sensor(s) [hydrothermal vent metagenome]|uniref:Diguanylate cyclase/phosphodiesterase (GGDEF & EAL domains) with PAS/PAC sensor(S) n=1 Tax=hydrothermal vent metagenome TaxID=652676 RepID=A0A3B0VBU9_9ZZZZ
MSNLSGKNVLICLSLNTERGLIFNYFEDKKCQRIYSAKNINETANILESKNIDVLVVECSTKILHSIEGLQQLISDYPQIKVILLIKKDFPLPAVLYNQLQQFADIILFEPLANLELEMKLGTLLLTSALAKNPKPAMDSQELWNIFFVDCLQAKLVVNASNHQITHINQALLDLIQLKESKIIGQPWQFFDDKANHKQYQNYIKEIVSKENTTFIIKYKNFNNTLNLKANYQMGVLNGEIVYLGVLTLENIQGVSDTVFKHLTSIHKTISSSLDFPILLDTIRKSLQLKFLLFLEYQHNKLIKPVSAGDNDSVNQFLNNSSSSLLSILKNNKELQIDRSRNRMSEYIKILDANNLQSFCVYPILHHNNIYGAIVAGGQNKIDSWQTISVLLNALANQCKLSLFQKNVVEQREIAGLVDNLTGLPNRSAMTKKLTTIIETGISEGKYLSLMIIDFDNINYFNKNIGIELTNQIIVSLAQIIVKSIRSKGQVYRLSRDEFVVLLQPHTDRNLVKYIVSELMEKLNNPVLLSNGEDANVNFNIGISIFPDDGQTVSSMMKNADLAMYDAKLAGNNNFVVFKCSETGQALKQKTQMFENLKKAITENHIKVFFQPKINALTEDIIGFEALVRWIDPEIGMINPEYFIPLAEETGLIHDIGDYVTKYSCKMVVHWQEKYGLELSCSINLSAVQLMDLALPKKLKQIINSSGAHPHDIDFEITETISLDKIPNLVTALNQIVDIGCTLSIDDFGTGHSSLDYIKKIPAKYIKIDQSFVSNIGLNPEDEAILDATIDIAKRLNRKLIAEGVETEEQREYLLERGCEYFQGYLFARPMPQEDIEQLLQERVALMGTH